MLTIEQIKTLINGLRQPILSIAKHVVEANKRATEALSQIEQGLPLKMDRENPVGVGSFSIGRSKGSTVGKGSFAAGSHVIASGVYSHAEGVRTIASIDASHAEGNGSEAIGLYSHAEGSSSQASGHSSHAEGQTSHAEGDYSHAEGNDSDATGHCSHAEGSNTKAIGLYSHAEGFRTIAEGFASHVEGRSNIPSNEYLHIVGNGDNSGDRRSNAHTLDWKGNAWYQGDVLVGSTSGTDRDEGSVRLAKITEVIPAPAKAEVGQTVRVSAVDENGVPTAWEAVTPDSWRLVRKVVIPEDPATDTSGVTWITNNNGETCRFTINTDEEGKPFSLRKVFISVVNSKSADATSTKNLMLFFNTYDTYNLEHAVFQNGVKPDGYYGRLYLECFRPIAQTDIRLCGIGAAPWGNQANLMGTVPNSEGAGRNGFGANEIVKIGFFVSDTLGIAPGSKYIIWGCD